MVMYHPEEAALHLTVERGEEHLGGVADVDEAPPGMAGMSRWRNFITVRWRRAGRRPGRAASWG
jgi:hypothetical protein